MPVYMFLGFSASTTLLGILNAVGGSGIFEISMYAILGVFSSVMALFGIITTE